MTNSTATLLPTTSLDFAALMLPAVEMLAGERAQVERSWAMVQQRRSEWANASDSRKSWAWDLLVNAEMLCRLDFQRLGLIT